MKKWFSMGKLPMTLIVVGLGLNVVEIATTPATSGASGGKLFGTTGILKSVNGMLPAMNLPGSAMPINIGGWMVIIGVVWLIIRKVS